MIKIFTFFLVFSLSCLPDYLLAQAKNSEEHRILAKETSQISLPRTPKIHIWFGIAYNTTRAIGNITAAYNSAGFAIDRSWNGSDHITWNIGADYSLTNHFRLGLSITQIPDLAFHSIQEGVGASEGTAMMSYSLFIEYVPSPVIYLLMSKLEFAAGAGAVYNSASVWNSLYSHYRGGVPSENVFNTIKEKLFGLHLRVRLDYYFHRNLSCQFKIDGRILRSIDMPAISFTNPIVDKTYELLDHPVNLSSIDLSMCLRFHF